jgi:FKBP-type peptidyl-prolyl cis-trans isomerase FkpA
MTRPFRTLAFAAAAVCALVACGASSTAPDIATTTFASSLNVHLSSMTKTSDGLYYQDSVVGTGTTALAGKTITVTYFGWLVDGTQFDAAPNFQFPLGVGTVIAGWDEGLVGMKVGGWRKLIIPPALAYGDQAVNKIPANSILVFNVQLTAVQ